MGYVGGLMTNNLSKKGSDYAFGTACWSSRGTTLESGFDSGHYALRRQVHFYTPLIVVITGGDYEY